MKKSSFIHYNITGSICWVTVMMISGHYLQDVIEKKYGFSLKDHIEGITIAIVLITTIPVLYKFFSGNSGRAKIGQSVN